MKNIFSIDFGTKRVYGLDILRALAIIIVLFSHGGTLLPVGLANIQANFLVDGVFLFFVLSGFLIGGILIKVLEQKKATIKNLFGFWVRRWFRTIPNYFLILTVLIIIGFTVHGGIEGANPLQYFLFFQNFSYPHPQFFSEAWTLSVEEWFYIMIPILLFVLVGVFKMVPKKAILTTVIAIVVASITLRLCKYSLHPVMSVNEWDSNFRKEVITRMDSLMFGVLGAYFAYYFKSLWVKHKVLLFWIGLGIVSISQVVSVYIAQGSRIAETGYGLYLSVFSFTVIAIGILLLLPFLSELKTGKGRVYKALTSISIASYSMYLIHVSLIQPFIFGLIVQGTTSHFLMIVRYALYWLLTIGVAILLYKYFEKPTTNLREKIETKKALEG
ncbi:MAG: acyltransferase [Candidatus Saccharibacteria bacterium]|nr:acyltransferase [Candidatus Saccharibacteria bacterium]